MRTAELQRHTKETQISVTLNLDGSGKSEINTGIGFFDHMLTLTAFHGGMDLKIVCKGDLHIDSHHSVEDTGILLGECLKKALGDKKGICRYAHCYLPMDEALTLTAVDISGRPYHVFDAVFRDSMLGTMQSQMVQHFFLSLAFNAGFTLHQKMLHGSNDHHIAESLFKGFGRSLKEAAKVISDELPSTKGVL